MDGFLAVMEERGVQLLEVEEETVTVRGAEWHCMAVEGVEAGLGATEVVKVVTIGGVDMEGGVQLDVVVTGGAKGDRGGAEAGG